VIIMDKNIEIKTHCDINEINETEWNHLARDSSVFYEYGWFKTFNNSLCLWIKLNK